VLDAEANKLILASSITSNGLQNTFAKAGCNARAVFVVHQLATRPDVWRVLETIRKAIDSLTSGSVKAGRALPPFSLFKGLLLTEFPQWRGKYSWIPHNAGFGLLKLLADDWDMTDWYAIPEEDRLAVVRDVERRFDDLCMHIHAEGAASRAAP
jgi:hypothetical protein